MTATSAMTKPDMPEVRELACFDPYEFHKSRYLCEHATVEHRNESGLWLVDAGFIGLDGKMILTNRKVAK